MSDIEEILEELSPSEKKVLMAMKELPDGCSPEDILKKGDFSGTVEVMNALSWLKAKGLVSMDERIVRYYSLKKK